MKETFAKRLCLHWVATASIILAFLVILILCVALIIVWQNDKFTEIEAQLASHSSMCGSRCGELANDLEWFKKNTTAQIFELKEKLKEMEDTMDAKEQALLDAGAEILQLERNITKTAEKLSETERELTEVAEKLKKKEEILEEALERATVFEAEHNRTMDRVSALEAGHREMAANFNLTRNELTTTREMLKVRVGDLENTLSITAAALETEHNRTIDRLLALEASYQEVATSLSLTRDELNITRVILQGRAQDIENTLTNTTARTAAIERELERMESDIETLNATKASREAVDERLAELNMVKADRSEVAVLSDNLTALEEASSREDEDIWQELRALADNTLNHSHYDHLQQALQHLQSSKASQIDFENLSSEVEVLANNTVRTDTFLSSIGTVENTTLLLQQSIHELELNFTSLNGTVHQISATLTTKADTQDLVTLSERVDSIDSSKVSTETFTELVSTVEGIQDSKAEQHDLDRVEDRVIMLEHNRATKTQLNSIEGDLERHTSSSDGVHTRLQSSIRTNTDNIDSNSDRITELENASPRLTGSWMTTIACVSVILVTVFVPLHT